MAYKDKMEDRDDLDRIDDASEGIKRAFLYERAIKVQLVILAIICSLFYWFFESWGLVKQTIIFGILIIATEMVNTCIEGICDIIQPKKDPRIKRIKDIGAGATLLFCIVAAAITITDITIILFG